MNRPKAYTILNTYFLEGKEISYFESQKYELDKLEIKELSHEIDIMYWGNTLEGIKNEMGAIVAYHPVTVAICRVIRSGIVRKFDPETIYFDPE